MYQLIQLDTNTLSKIIKERDETISRFIKKFPPDEKNVIAISIFSVIELKRSKELFQGFCEMFSIIPSFILKGIDDIREEELKNYKLSDQIDPKLLCPYDLSTNTPFCEVEDLKKLFTHPKVNNVFNHWEQRKEQILTGIISLIKNYPPKNDKYTENEINFFIRQVTFNQIRDFNPEFINENKITPENLNLSKVPSFRIMTEMVFYKFYPDKRKPLGSDVFDLVISLTFPYVNKVITEGNMKEILNKVHKRTNFLNPQHIMTISEM